MNVRKHGINAKFHFFSRYGDASWGNREYSMRRPYTSTSFINESRRGLRRTATEKIFSSSWANYDFKCNQVQPRLGPIETSSMNQNTNLSIHSSPSISQDFKSTKRKTFDCDLDLDLSLRITAKEDKQQNSEQDDVVSELSLSLYSPSSSSSKLNRLKSEEDHCTKKNARRVSTLDLTI